MRHGLEKRASAIDLRGGLAGGLALGGGVGVGACAVGRERGHAVDAGVDFERSET